MKAKSIQLPAFAATAIAAVEDLAQRENLSVGHAAARLIEAGQAAMDASPRIDEQPAPLALVDIHLDALLNEVRRRFDGACRPEEIANAVARAEAAEAELGKLKSKIKAIAA